jgi:hypothetical protein
MYQYGREAIQRPKLAVEPFQAESRTIQVELYLSQSGQESAKSGLSNRHVSVWNYYSQDLTLFSQDKNQ